MMDGIYIIKDRLGDAGPTKTLVTPAYNYRGLSLADLSSSFTILPPADWWDHFDLFNFVQDDDILFLSTHESLEKYNFNVQDCNPTMGYACPKNGIGCLINSEYNTWCTYYDIKDFRPWCKYYGFYIDSWEANGGFPQNAISAGDNYRLFAEDREVVFGFPDPTPSGDILYVTVWAEVRGKCKLSLNSAYGDPTTETHLFAWESLRYDEKPGGGAWAWSDINSLAAGVYLYFIDDLREGACRRLKVIVTTTTGDITLWPDSNEIDKDSSLPMVGNYLEDVDLCDALIAYGEANYPAMPLLYKIRDSEDSDSQNVYYTSDLSEIAPAFSVIGSIKVTFGYGGNTGSTGYARAFLEIAGTRYYGTSHALGADFEYQEFDETWSTDPSTSAAWNYDSYKTVKFGAHAWLDEGTPNDSCFILKLVATTSFQERKLEPDFTALNAYFISRRSEEQSALISDDLIFLSTIPIAERTRIAYFDHDAIRFVGFVWNVAESNGIYKINAKGYQEILKYRFVPSINYAFSLNSAFKKFTIDDILSASPPTHPLHSHISCTLFKNESSWYAEWTNSETDNFIMTHETVCGLMWIINSFIPASSGDSAGKIPFFGPRTIGRAVYGLDRIQAQTIAEYDAYLGEWTYYYVKPDYFPVPYLIYGSGNACHGPYGQLDYGEGTVGGVRRLAKHTSSTCTIEQYYPATDGGLYVMPWPGNQEILIDGAMDCYVDLDENDAGDSFLNEVPVLEGSASEVLLRIFELSGMEVCARPGADGRLHLTALTANGRGSAVAPMAEFVDGVDCEIESTTSLEPPVDVAVGYDRGAQAALDLTARRYHFAKIIQTDRTGDDLDDYLDAVIDDDTTEYRIITGSEHAYLLPSDWISIDGIPARIRAIEEYPEKVIITAGKQLKALKESFGEWRHMAAQSDESMISSSVAYTGSDCPIEVTFTVKASDYMRGDWAARLRVEWTVTIPDKATVAELTATPKLWATIGDIVIPPGKVLLNGKTGSLVFDVSAACAKSTTTDTENTLKIYMADHKSQTASPTFYHTVSGAVEQYRVAAVLTNA